MKAALLSLLLSLPLLATQNAWSRDSVLPAGTLVQCTLDEPNFSSATASVGDPLLCHPHGLQVFGQTVFPRGTYLVGHLADDKDPGHFWGKGFLKIEFDRIGLPGADLPLSAKIIAVNGYRVDREGKIIGKGHAKRDIVEWLFPPLWPWKIISLPMRGPRPRLKGETRVTLRLMDDIIVPESAQWQRFGPGDGSYARPALMLRPRRIAPPATIAGGEYHTAVFRPQASSAPVRAADDAAPTNDSRGGWKSFRKSGTPLNSAPATSAATADSAAASVSVPKKAAIVETDLPPAQQGNTANNADQDDSAEPATSPQPNAAPAAETMPAPSTAETPASSTGDSAGLARSLPGENAPETSGNTQSQKPRLTLLAVRAGNVYAVTDYWRDEDQLVYLLANGKQGQIQMDDLDWKTTSQLNNERNVKVTVREGR
jgi:hypothetical protein